MAKEFICSNCGYQGNSKTLVKGSLLMEIVLWACFIVPGLLYSLWRLTTKHQGCPQCSASNLVPIDSPRGKKLIEEFR